MSAPEGPAPSDPRRVFEALERNEVDYVTIGGIAVQAWGVPRTTQDVDLIPAPGLDNAGRLAAALSELGARLSGVDADRLGIDPLDPETLAGGANFTLETAAGGLDVFGEVPGAPRYRELAGRAVTVEVESVRVRVCDLADLIAMKEASGREHDRRDLRTLREIREREQR